MDSNLPIPLANEKKEEFHLEFSLVIDEETGEEKVSATVLQREGEPAEQAYDRILQNLMKFSGVELAQHQLNLTANALPGKKADAANEVVQFLCSMQPQDATEGMLYSQMLALHTLGLRYLDFAKEAKTYRFQDSSMNHAIKLLKLHHETLETLSRYRRKGEQKVVVQHVNVNQGGQAIVGHVEHRGRGKEQNVGSTPCS
ncbi:MAG: hypothetical protein BGO10_01365 [Chlamydia sp. 32-24]|nr:MAG: hypothetical protein BGO10_01365 [Chlamydia sp. 32-24]